MKFWYLQISPNANQTLDRFLAHEAEICQTFGRLLGTPQIHSEINWPLEGWCNCLILLIGGGICPNLCLLASLLQACNSWPRLQTAGAPSLYTWNSVDKSYLKLHLYFDIRNQMRIHEWIDPIVLILSFLMGAQGCSETKTRWNF